MITAAETERQKTGQKMAKRDLENAKKHMRCCINGEVPRPTHPPPSLCVSSLSQSVTVFLQCHVSHFALGAWFVSRMLDFTQERWKRRMEGRQEGEKFSHTDTLHLSL